MEQDYFSVNNLGKLAGIDGHMGFIEELVEKYSQAPWDGSREGDAGSSWGRIREQLGLIRKKMDDKKLNISVIGEFSTGKSTFINALLRNDLLASSALQGTTVASTVMDYGSQHRMHLEYLDGREAEETYLSFARLKEDLDKYTTDPQLARQLKTVRVYLPSEILKNSFRIIDTPGTNVTEAWHEDVTVRTLQNDSDLSIILVSAEKPVPETMLRFIGKNLAPVLPQCIFVVTKLDLIRKRERERQLAYIKMKLEEELGIRDAVVLPYVSPMVLDSQAPDCGRRIERKNICILGEMGGGKRSVAEAVLGKKICSSVLPLSPVIKIMYGEAPTVRFRLNETRKLVEEYLPHLPGRLQEIIKKHHGKGIPEIEVSYGNFRKAFLEGNGMQWELFSLFNMVTMLLPLEGLRDRYQFTICDTTEGFPSCTGKWDLDIGSMTDVIMVKNFCNPMSQKERSFIQEFIVPYCKEKVVFVRNKVDLVAPGDIPEMKEYEERTLGSLVPSPRICYTAARLGREGVSELLKELEAAPGYQEQGGGKPADEALLELSLQTEQELVEHTVKQKALALTKKMTALVDDIYTSVSMEMDHISQEYEGKLALLERSHKTDLNEFVSLEKKVRLRHFDEAMRKRMDDMEEDINTAAGRVKDGILGELDEKGTIDQLKDYISNTLGGDCSQGAKGMISKMDGYYKQAREQFAKEMSLYNMAFKKNYEALKLLPVDMSKPQYSLPDNIVIETADISATANYIADELARENRAFFGGMAAGAAVGTAVAPGVGTVIGGIIGFFAGGGLSPDTGKVREECKGKLRPQLTSYYNSICNKMITALEQYRKKIRQCLSNEIDGYLVQYRKEVEHQIAVENSKKSLVQSKINELSSDREQIHIRKNQLESVILQLNSLGRKD